MLQIKINISSVFILGNFFHSSRKIKVQRATVVLLRLTQCSLFFKKSSSIIRRRARHAE